MNWQILKMPTLDLVKVSKHLLNPDFLKPPVQIGKQFRNQVIYKKTLPWIDADDKVFWVVASHMSQETDR